MRAAIILGSCLLLSADSRYVGSKACASCHSKIYSDYLKTAMGRSIVPAEQSPLGTATVQSGNMTYEVSRRTDGLYQSESETDASGKVVFTKSYRLEYAIGSGVNGISYAIRRDGFLFEAPLSYYSRTGTWQLSPGYEHENVGFSRLIPSQCLGCHSARPDTNPKAAIGCENCHGPGGRHVDHPTKESIVNPARIDRRLADDICMNCHQAGDTRVFEPGKTAADFRPGTPLSETVAIFKIPPDPAEKTESVLLEHNFAMSLSKCYRASNGRLGCGTCHDPHAMPKKTSTPSYYETNCLKCHGINDCTLQKKTGCIGCHMPKAEVGYISHSALTNHRITRKPGSPLPSDFPDLIYLNGRGDKPATPIVLLQAYGELMARAPQYKIPYLKLLDELASAPAPDPLVQAALGRRALLDGKVDDATDQLSKAIKSGYTAPTAFEDLANALSKQQKTTDAIDVLKQGIDLSPYAPRLHKLLMVQYINLGQYDLAKAEMRHYLDLFPEDDFVRDLLRKVEG